MDKRQAPSIEALIALSGAYLLSSIAERVAGSAVIFIPDPKSFASTSALWFTLTIAVAPLVAFVVRRQPAWLTVAVSQLVMALGISALFLTGDRYATQLAQGLVSIGHLAVSATLLVVAWRAPSHVTAALAGVFVLPRILSDAVLIELLRRESMVGLTPLLVTALCLTAVGAGAAVVVRFGESGGVADSECSLDRSMILGATLALIGAATFAAQPEPYGTGAATGFALLALTAGLVVIGVTKQNRTTEAPAIHIDTSLLVMCGVVATLSIWTRFGFRFFGTASTGLGPNISTEFDNVLDWSRATTAIVALGALPLVQFVARGDRRLLSVGAGAIAAAGLSWVFFVLADAQLGLVDFLIFTLLIEWGTVVVLGGTIAIALTRAEDASVEAGLVVFLAGLRLVEAFARQVPFEIVGDQLLESGFADTGNLELFTVASAIGLIWVAAWWALRPDSGERSTSKPGIEI